MHKKILLAHILFAGGLVVPTVPAAAQSAFYTPQAGSAERRAIMNALRVPVEKDLAYNASPETNGKGLKRPVIFKIPKPTRDLCVTRNWAFVYAIICRPDGEVINYDSPAAAALLHRVHGVWSVITHETGGEISPLPWADWSRKYHAPSALFPKS